MLSRALNLIFPPQCLNCDSLVPTHGTLCQQCWQQLHFITHPMCACCGAPFEYAIGEGARCAPCIQEAPIFDSARSILVFEDASKQLIHKLKFQDDTYLAQIFAQWMHQQAAEFILQADAIIPVPLNRWRLASRRYNQSGLLAHKLSVLAGKPYQPNLLQRIRRTQPQTGLNKTEREENLRDAFAVSDLARPVVHGMRVLLVDDVLTTGATVHACTKALLKAGAAEVHVLTLARVVRYG